MRARIAASVVLAAALLLGTSGCAFFSPQSTLLRYDPSDGVGTSVGSVKVRNAFLLTKDGERASMLINFINDGTSSVDLTVQYTLKPGGETTKTLHLKPGEVKTYGKSETDQFILQGIDKKPGQLYAVWFQYGDHTGVQLLLPILDGTWSQYKGLLPTNAPTPTPTATATPAPAVTQPTVTPTP